MSSISIKDIAQIAQVSHSTVSRAIHHSPLVNGETGDRIRQIACRMGYRPSAVARSLVTKKTWTIGVVVTTIADPFIARRESFRRSAPRSPGTDEPVVKLHPVATRCPPEPSAPGARREVPFRRERKAGTIRLKRRCADSGQAAAASVHEQRDHSDG